MSYSIYNCARISTPGLIVLMGQICSQLKKIQNIIFKWILIIISDNRQTEIAKLIIYIIKTQLLCLFVRIVLKRWRNKKTAFIIEIETNFQMLLKVNSNLAFKII